MVPGISLEVVALGEGQVSSLGRPLRRFRGMVIFFGNLSEKIRCGQVLDVHFSRSTHLHCDEFFSKVVPCHHCRKPQTVPCEGQNQLRSLVG